MNLKRTHAGMGRKCEFHAEMPECNQTRDSANHHTMMPPCDPFICDHNVEFLYSIKEN